MTRKAFYSSFQPARMQIEFFDVSGNVVRTVTNTGNTLAVTVSCLSCMRWYCDRKDLPLWNSPCFAGLSFSWLHQQAYFYMPLLLVIFLYMSQKLNSPTAGTFPIHLGSITHHLVIKPGFISCIDVLSCECTAERKKDMACLRTTVISKNVQNFCFSALKSSFRVSSTSLLHSVFRLFRTGNDHCSSLVFYWSLN